MHIHRYIHTHIHTMCLWNTTLVVVPIYELRPCTSKHRLLKPHAMSNCIFLFIFSHLDIYLPEISFLCGLRVESLAQFLPPRFCTQYPD